MSVKTLRSETIRLIDQNATDFIVDRKKSNNLVDIIGYLEDQDVKVVLATVRAVHRICSHILDSGDLALSNESTTDAENADKQKVYISWLKDRYSDCCDALCTLICHENTSVQDLSLCVLMKLLKLESETAVGSQQNRVFPVHVFKKIISSLVQCDSESTDLIAKFQEYMEYDDLRYFAMKSILELLKSHSDDTNSAVCLNIFALLVNLNCPESTDADTLTNFYTGTSADTKLSSSQQHRKLFQTVWLEFLKKKLPTGLYHKVLAALDDKVMPYMTNPLQLSDFLISSYNTGGATSLLALNGLFRLIHGYNLDYPDFYQKLYALLEPTIFHVKYRARFFYLLDLFLTSTHLPAYLVAAFIKRLCRLCLTAPVDGLCIVIPLVFNLVLRHKACSVMLHRPGCSDLQDDPYDPDEADPMKCQAIESSLWELKSLMQHYHHSVAVEAKKLEQPLPKLESDLAAQLDNNVDDLMAVELKKKWKEVAKTFEIPTGLFTTRGGSWNSDLWTWT